MSKSILVPLHQIQFPPQCVNCLSPASKKYKIEQIFTYGRNSYTVHVDVPMCDPHFEAASFKGTAERVTSACGIVVGILGGLLAVILLLLRWQGNVSLIFKIFGGALFGFGMFLLAWYIISIVIAPHLAVPQAKEARNAVRVTRFLQGEQMVQLEFRNERMADLLRGMN
jgi:hypothetical protein